MPNPFTCTHEEFQLTPYRGGLVCECGTLLNKPPEEKTVDHRGIINCHKTPPVGPGPGPRRQVLPANIDDLLLVPDEAAVDNGDLIVGKNTIHAPAPGATRTSLEATQTEPLLLKATWTFKGRRYERDVKIPSGRMVEYVSTEHGMLVVHTKDVPTSFPRAVDVRG